MVAKEPKKLGSAEAVLAEVQARHPYPLTAVLELTRECNLRCKHCYLDVDHQEGLPFEEISRILDELKQMGTLFIGLTGGEVSVRSDWLDIAETAKTKGFALKIKTNGSQLKEDEIQRIKSLTPLSVDISLYAPTAEAHDAITCIKGSFDRTLWSIRALRDAGVRVVAAIPVLAQTAHLLEQTTALAKELGCFMVVDTRICGNLDAACDRSDVVPSEAQINAAVTHVESLGAPSAEHNTPKILDKKGPWPCINPPSTVYIRADGSLWHCPILPVPLGSVTDGPIGEVWLSSGARIDLQRRACHEPEECKTCEKAWACHRCAGHAWLEHESLELPATIDCQTATARCRSSMVREGV